MAGRFAAVYRQAATARRLVNPPWIAATYATRSAKPARRGSG